jgi:hypothetical protein
VPPLDGVTRAELAEGLEKSSKEIAKRLLLLKEQRWNLVYPIFRKSQERASSINSKRILGIRKEVVVSFGLF